MDLKKCIPVIPNWPRAGVDFLDVTGILARPDVYDHVINQLTQQVSQYQATSLVAIESRGFLFASPIAKDLGLPLIILRKPGKLPGPVHTISYETEYSTDSLSIKIDSPVGKRPCMVDDLIATGGTLLAAASLLKHNFDVDCVTSVAVIGLDFLDGRKKIESAGISLHTLVDYA